MEAYEYLEKIRAAAPRVHCITNYVTAHDVANMILACGANPVMADEPQEMGEITAHAGALALNMGTPGERREQAMLAAGKAANANGIPVLLDPVGVGAIDLVSDGQQCVVIRGGREEMSRVTGTGCQLSGLAAAFLAVARNMEAPAGSTVGNTAVGAACAARGMEAVAAAVCVMNAAGEIAWEQRGLCGGNASYGTGIIDAVYRMDQKMLEGRIRYEVR